MSSGVNSTAKTRQNIYSVALGKYTEAMNNCLKGEEIYEYIDGESDVIRLLLLINSIAYSYESKSYPVLAIHMALRKFYSSYQSSSSSCDEYLEMMNILREVIFHFGGVIGNHLFLVGKILKATDTEDPDNPTENETAVSNTATEEAYMATAFLSGLNSAIYGVLLNEFHNAFCMVRDEYPKTLTAAYDLEIKWKGDTKGTGVTPNYGVAFTTNSEEVDVHTTDGMKLTRTENPVICHICGNNHYANRCPDREEITSGRKVYKAEETPKKESPPTKASVNLKIGEDWRGDTNYGALMFYQVTAWTAVEYQHTRSQSGRHINPTRVLLYNQSNVDILPIDVS